MLGSLFYVCVVVLLAVMLLCIVAMAFGKPTGQGRNPDGRD